MSNSRTRNSIRNFGISMGAQIIALTATFINRTIFIRILNADYLGIDGLFTNILMILSFAELGIGSAVIYSMYKPVLQRDSRQVGALLNLYRSAYRIIAIVIFMTGLALTPFLHIIIEKQPAIKENLQLLYWLCLGNTVSSYLFSYRKALFTANQKEYVNVAIERSIRIGMTAVQLIFLYLTHNYIYYLSIQIVSTLLCNLILHFLARKKFPEVFFYKDEKMEPSEVKKIFKNISAIFCYKIGSVVLNATDNIIITKIIGLSIVGVCSNYTLLINTVESVLSRALNSIVASIGNLNATDDKTAKLEVMNQLSVCVYWIYGFCSIELALLLSDTIGVWLGSDYILNSTVVVFALVLSFYIYGTNFVPSNYRVTMGYFRDARLIPLFAALLNIVLSVLLGMRWGLFGVYISTSIARILTFGIVDPITVLKKGLSVGAKKFYFRQAMFFALTVANGLVCKLVISQIPIAGFGGLLVDGTVIAVMSNTIFFLVFYRTKEFKAVLKRLRGALKIGQ